MSRKSNKISLQANKLNGCMKYSCSMFKFIQLNTKLHVM